MPQQLVRSVAALTVLIGSVLGVNGLQGASGATPPVNTQASGNPGAPLVWPGGGRMLSEPLVVGGNVVGMGSLEMIGDTITTEPAGLLDAPPELSLRLFTFVAKPDGGFSAILRFRTPIVVLHSWRQHAVRQTMTVVLTPPGGGARAVQFQPDGAVMEGSFSAGQFAPAGPGKAFIVGDVAVFDIPASIGATSDWTVQAIVKLQADEPLHRNRAATGYAAGTSVVPIGLLTGASVPPSGWGLADAATALTAATSAPVVATGLRPLAIRLEGEGKNLTAVVTLDGPPSKVSIVDHPHLDLDVAPPRYATLERPMRVSWRPDGAKPSPSARVSIDGVAIGEVPVEVSAGKEVRFRLGAATVARTVAAPSIAPLDRGEYHNTVPLVQDEAVKKIDGMTAYPLTSGSAQNPDNATIDIVGSRVTITPQSSGAAATGAIDSLGHFAATSPADMFTGAVDATGNVVIYRTSLSARRAPAKPAVGSRVVGGTPVIYRGPKAAADPSSLGSDQIPSGPDYGADGVGGAILQFDRDWEDYIIELQSWKNRLAHGWVGGPPAEPTIPSVLFPPVWLSANTGADASGNAGASGAGTFGSAAGSVGQPAGAQGGNPDWPMRPVLTEPGPNGSVDSYVLRVSSGTFDQGRPIEVTTPWVESSLLTAAAPRPASPTGGASPVGADSKSGNGGGSGVVTIALGLGAIAVIAGATLFARRRRATRVP